MTVELMMLVLSTGLLLAILVVQGTAGVISNGLETQAGARDDLPEQKLFHARVTRLRANMIENLMLFTPIVLIVHAVGVSNDITVLGAQIFFFARVAHAIVYMLGWPWVRPATWAIAMVGTLMVASQLPI